VKLRVSNFNPSLTKGDLEEIFEEYGRVVSIKVFKDPNPNTPKALAFVEMRSETAATQAIESLNGTELDGFPIKVEISSDIINHNKAKIAVSKVDDLLDEDEEDEDEDDIDPIEDDESYVDEDAEEEEEEEEDTWKD